MKFFYQSVFNSGQVLQHARRWAHHEGRHGHMHHRLLKGLQPILNNAKKLVRKMEALKNKIDHR